MNTHELFNQEIIIKRKVQLPYLLSLPKNYDQTEENFPFVLFLHGMGERGNDLESVKNHGIAKLAETQDFPFISVSPQCPDDIFRYSTWIQLIDELKALIDYIVQNYRVDKTRIYVTGLSMGGFGTWELIKSYPELFAAAAPICGGGSIKEIERIKDIPIWAFHGAKDDVVLLEESEKMVDALKSVGGNVKLTIYPEAEHDSWTETYDNPEFYEWLLSQKKK